MRKITGLGEQKTLSVELFLCSLVDALTVLNTHVTHPADLQRRQ